MSFLKNLRAFTEGAIGEADLRNNVDPEDISEYEEDEEFMQECMQLCMPTMLMMDMLGETADELDESVRDAYYTLQDYLVGQGMISEAATVKINNPKINVVHLSKNAQMKRLTSIITLKMARKDNSKNYQKYKLGQKIKKTNMEDMRKKYGAKAERLAKKLFAKKAKSGKIAAVVDKKSPTKKK